VLQPNLWVGLKDILPYPFLKNIMDILFPCFGHEKEIPTTEATISGYI
jgi:hypothetical protein